MADKTYEKGAFKVRWQSDLCTHCEDCYFALPKVFNPNRRPWVDLEAAPTEDIADQVMKCPSGALSILKAE